MANIDRRDFLKLVGAGGVGIGAGFLLAQSIKHPVEYLVPYPVSPEDYSQGIATWYNSVCRMCNAGCGISVRTLEGRAKKIEGNSAHPVNQGRLCALGQAGLQVLYNPDRLTAPMTRAGADGSFEPITWDDGLGRLAERLEPLLAGDRGNRVCFLSKGTRGHLEDVISRFMALIGSERFLDYDNAHPAALYAANRRFFGEEYLPYYDIENAQCLVSFGADFLGNWISPVNHALQFGRSRGNARKPGGWFAQIEPRMSISGAAADEWIPARPGSEGLLALALARHLLDAGAFDGDDRDLWAAVLRPYDTESVSARTGVPGNTMRRLADRFAHGRPSLAIGGGPAGAHSGGVDTLMAVNALNYLAGNLGRSGGVLFNSPPAFRTAQPAVPAGYAEMAALASDARDGRIEVLIVHDANPVFTLPPAAGFRDALKHIPMVVSLSSFLDETTAEADLILPSHSYLESWGDDFPEPGVGFSTGTVSQPVVSPLYNTRSTGDTILALANKLGLEASPRWTSIKQRIEDGWREIYERGPESVKAEGFESFWTSVVESGVWGAANHRDHADTAVAETVFDDIRAGDPEFAGDSDAFPFVLLPYATTTMGDGRGANLPWMQELPDPLTSVVYGSWVEVNPVTARRLGVSDGDLVRVESTEGQLTAPVCVFPGVMPDVIAMPVGQGHSAYGRYARNRGANPIQILAPQQVGTTGDLAWLGTRVRLTATGRRAPLVRTGGESRDLGRNIVRKTGGGTEVHHESARSSIPIKVMPK